MEVEYNEEERRGRQDIQSNTHDTKQKRYYDELQFEM